MKQILEDEGISLVKKYDGEFPQKYYETFLKYCDITEEQFQEFIDSWRSDHIWEKTSEGWVLKHPIWKD